MTTRFYSDGSYVNKGYIGYVDPYYANVVLLLHCDGANGSTTFTDSAPVPKAVTANGNAQISTAQSQFGGSSALFDGTGDYLNVGNSTDFDFGGGDFTIEMFVRLGTVTGNHHLIAKYQTTATGAFAIFQGAASIDFFASSNGTTWNLVSALNFGTSFVINTWYHLAVTRSGNVYRTFRDGVQIATTTVSGSLITNTQNVYVGRGTNGVPSEYNGYLDEIRITKGVARYTADFSLQVASFPNR